MRINSLKMCIYPNSCKYLCKRHKCIKYHRHNILNKKTSEYKYIKLTKVQYVDLMLNKNHELTEIRIKEKIFPWDNLEYISDKEFAGLLELLNEENNQ